MGHLPVVDHHKQVSDQETTLATLGSPHRSTTMCGVSFSGINGRDGHIKHGHEDFSLVIYSIDCSHVPCDGGAYLTQLVGAEAELAAVHCCPCVGLD